MLTRLENFISNINEVSLYWHRMTAVVMKKHGLRGSTASYFIQLYNHPEGLPAASLCKLCGKDKGDVSREIANLEKLGLVERASSEKRGYRAPITLTESGKKVAREVTRTAAAAMLYVVKPLEDEEAEQFRSAFDKIAANMRTLSEEQFEEHYL